MREPEQWAHVYALQGRYQVSNLGRVRSVGRTERDILGRRKRIATKLLTPVVMDSGYVAVKLPERGTCRIHMLVMESFVGPRPPGLQVLHHNGDRADARLTNLRYGTPKENMADARRHGTLNIGARNGGAKLTDERVMAARALHGRLSVARLSAAFGVAAPSLKKAIGTGTRPAWSHVSETMDEATAWRIFITAERALTIRLSLPFMVAALQERRRATARA